MERPALCHRLPVDRQSVARQMTAVAAAISRRDPQRCPQLPRQRSRSKGVIRVASGPVRIARRLVLFPHVLGEPAGANRQHRAMVGASQFTLRALNRDGSAGPLRIAQAPRIWRRSRCYYRVRGNARNEPVRKTPDVATLARNNSRELHRHANEAWKPIFQLIPGPGLGLQEETTSPRIP